MRNLSIWFQTRLDSNQPVQVQGLATFLKYVEISKYLANGQCNGPFVFVTWIVNLSTT